jgi:NADPH-dependent glutamate synthase beta subunit-like oxidoreductase
MDIETTSFDVIVAGAGPVGLTLAIDLGRRGVRVPDHGAPSNDVAMAEDGSVQRPDHGDLPAERRQACVLHSAAS